MNQVSEKRKIVDWSNLPVDLCLSVAGKIPSVAERVRVGALCRSWRTAVSNHKQYLFPPKSPFLFLIGYEEAGNTFVFPYHMPRIQGRACFATPYGWFITLSLNRQVHLLNTTSGVRHQFPRIELPYIDSWVLRAMHKAVTSFTSPSSSIPEDCVVVIIFSKYNQLAFAKLYDRIWTTLEYSATGYDDLLYYKGHFYAVNCVGELKVCDIGSPHPGVKEFASPPAFRSNTNLAHGFVLVEINGQLHMIVRTVTIFEEDPEEDTTTFDIYMLDFEAKKWIEVAGIQQHALLVGGNSCYSILASDYPDFKGNCIYFTVDSYTEIPTNSRCRSVMGDFDLKLKEIVEYGAQGIIDQCCPALWIIP